MNIPKYHMEEYHINEYSLNMNLTIKDLEKHDFGGYNCSSVNALGKAESTVRLTGITYIQILICVIIHVLFYLYVYNKLCHKKILFS